MRTSNCLFLTLVSVSVALGQQPVEKLEFAPGSESWTSPITGDEWTYDGSFAPEHASTCSDAWTSDGSNAWWEGPEDANNWMPDTSFSLFAVVAARSHATRNSPLFSWKSGAMGIEWGFDRFGRPWAAWGDGATTLDFLAEDRLELNVWSTCGLTFNSADQTVTLFLNGLPVAEHFTLSDEVIWPQNNTIHIGRGLTGDYVAGSYRNSFNGGISELAIFAGALTEAEILALHDDADCAGLAAPLPIPASRFEGDAQRPKWHGMPDAAWTNEPHGLSYFDNEWHLFFQKNAGGPYWDHIHWGHLTSPDGVLWTEKEIALQPDPGGYDREGVWSGDVLDPSETGGEVRLYYTGVDGASAQVCQAFPDGTGQFVKDPSNPIIADPPANLQTLDFRDPFFWKQGGVYWMIIGSGLVAQGGVALLYKSDDLETWTYDHVFMYADPSDDAPGIFWEMPAFLDMSGEAGAPAGLGYFITHNTPENAPAKTLYWEGTFDDETGYFYPFHSESRSWDLFRGQLAPSFRQNDDGSWASIGIVPDEASGAAGRGWANAYSMLRRVTWDAGGPVQQPDPAVLNLRGDLFHAVENHTVASGETYPIYGAFDRHWEWKARVDLAATGQLDVVIASGEGEETVLRLAAFGMVQLDRTNQSLSGGVPTDVQTASLEWEDPSDVEVQIFLDGSILEVFLDGRHAFATRIFPFAADLVPVKLVPLGGPVTLHESRGWAYLGAGPLSIHEQEVSPKGSCDAWSWSDTNPWMAEAPNVPQHGIQLRAFDSTGKLLEEQNARGVTQVSLSLPHGTGAGLVTVQLTQSGEVCLTKKILFHP